MFRIVAVTENFNSGVSITALYQKCREKEYVLGVNHQVTNDWALGHERLSGCMAIAWRQRKGTLIWRCCTVKVVWKERHLTHPNCFSQTLA